MSWSGCRSRRPVCVPTVLLDAHTGLLDRQPDHDIDPTGLGLAPHNLAYVIYTSGSTGQPKGVMVEHGSIANFIYSMSRAPGITQRDTLLAVTTISFDIAGLELYLPLAS